MNLFARRFSALISASIICAFAAFSQAVNFCDEATDTVRINNLLSKAIAITDPNERVEMLAREFIGTPYVAATLEADGDETLTVCASKVDCTTLIDNIMALGITAGERRQSWRDFVYNLRNIRYRGGETNGYASRLHYISDWVVDNVHRGNFTEVTGNYPDAAYDVKTLNFMTANRNLYPALADDATFMAMKNVEGGYRNHRTPIIKSKSIAKASKGFLRSGDIIALTTSKKGLDVSHMGVVIMDNGTAYLLHASSKEGRVIIDRLPLAEYLAKNRSLTGIRVFRLKE